VKMISVARKLTTAPSPKLFVWAGILQEQRPQLRKSVLSSIYPLYLTSDVGRLLTLHAFELNVQVAYEQFSPPHVSGGTETSGL
jgi:hypothetical protein